MKQYTHPHPSAEQLELIERFWSAHNEIEAELRFKLQEPDDTSFIQLIHLYAERNPVWGDRDGRHLRQYSSLRNALAHQKRKQLQYLSVPLPFIVEDIERIRDALLQKKRVIPEFQLHVETLRLSDPLSKALATIEAHDYSQFPVYDRDDRFAGLLTENGVTRWLAHHTVHELTLVDFQDALVEDVLREEEQRPTFGFASRRTLVEDVVAKFGRNPFLEAVLITETGKKDEELLGIATRWDVIEVIGG
jgi:predicted transcriptional regulator